MELALNQVDISKELARLETRKCKCGCRRTFRVLPESKQEVFSVFECGKKVPNEGRLEYKAYHKKAHDRPSFTRKPKKNHWK